MSHAGAFVLLLSFVPVTEPVRPKADDLAKEVAAQFCRALGTGDLAALMKTVDVPWFHDGKKVITERDELAKEFADVLARKSLKNVQVAITTIQGYPVAKAQFKDGDQQLLEKLQLGKEDRVVTLTMMLDGKNHKLLLPVRVRQGVARIVGLRD